MNEQTRIVATLDRRTNKGALIGYETLRIVAVRHAVDALDQRAVSIQVDVRMYDCTEWLAIGHAWFDCTGALLWLDSACSVHVAKCPSLALSLGLGEPSDFRDGWVPTLVVRAEDGEAVVRVDSTNISTDPPRVLRGEQEWLLSLWDWQTGTASARQWLSERVQ